MLHVTKYSNSVFLIKKGEGGGISGTYRGELLKHPSLWASLPVQGWGLYAPTVAGTSSVPGQESHMPLIKAKINHQIKFKITSLKKQFFLKNPNLCPDPRIAWGEEELLLSVEILAAWGQRRQEERACGLFTTSERWRKSSVWKGAKNAQYIWRCQISPLILEQTLNLQKKLITSFTWQWILIRGFHLQEEKEKNKDGGEVG